MRPLLTAAETQALDRGSEERGVSVAELMERAGLAVADATVRLAGGAYGRRAVVLCGKGNNGGDGLVAARHLARWGMAATVLLFEDPQTLRGPAEGAFRRLGTVPWKIADPETLERELARADVAVDAIFGSGFRGAAEGPHAAAIGALNAAAIPVVAVDVPSGVETDTGLARGAAVTATVTVTFGAPKLGDVLFPGASHAGELEIVDIGFPPDLLRADVQLVEADDVRALLPERSPEDHKRRSGVVLVVAGSRTMPGAAGLVGAGAYRAGAGLVRIATPESALSTVHAELPEATHVPLPEGPSGSVAESAWEILDVSEAGAVAVGPGLSTADETPAFVRRLVRECAVPMVVDADAINAFAGRPGDLAERVSELVLTPHTAEMGRLLGIPTEEVLEDRIGLARKAAAETRAVVVLKGPRTVVASPDGEVRVNPTGSPSLATGGTGDVLTGVIAAYLARGLLPLAAATAGVYVHGLAGEQLPEGALASEVADALPDVLRRLREDG